MGYAATYEAPLAVGKTVYSFDVGVIDYRTMQRCHICISANSKASAGKLARQLGYGVHSMSFI